MNGGALGGRDSGGNTQEGRHVPWPSQGAREDDDDEEEDEDSDDKLSAGTVLQKAAHCSAGRCVCSAVQPTGRRVRQLSSRLADPMELFGKIRVSGKSTLPAEPTPRRSVDAMLYVVLLGMSSGQYCCPEADRLGSP